MLVEVHAQGSKHRHQVIGMFLQLGGFPNRGQSVVVSNEVEGVVRLLQLQRGSQGTKIVALMGSARRLDACLSGHANGSCFRSSHGNFCCCRENIDETTVVALASEADHTITESKKRVVLANTHVLTCMEGGPYLANQNISRLNDLSTKALNATAFAN